MKRRYVVIVVLALLVLVGIDVWRTDFLGFGNPVWIVTSSLARFSVPRAHSEVAVTSDVGWWPYQEGLKVSEFSAEAVSPKLNMFNDRFLLRYHLKGTIKFREDWKPRIGKAQITERVVSRHGLESVANVLVVPVVSVTQDSRYSGEEITFEVTLERIVHTMNWGRNVYEITCGDKIASISVNQEK